MSPSAMCSGSSHSGHCELLACAYALFAFWASGYPRTATPIHHLFGVMIAVSEFLPQLYAEHWDAETLYPSLVKFLETPPQEKSGL